jgi:polysaccharide export outer membrane protein
MGYLRRSNTVLFLFLILLIALSSCVPRKKMLYIQNALIADSAKKEYLSKPVAEYRVRPGDNLFIRVLTLDEKISDYLNSGSSISAAAVYEASLFLSSYSVNDSGYIDLPFANELLVAGFTMEEIKDKINSIIGNYLKDATVIVKLVNFDLTFLGEVVQPGEYKIYQNRINIFEALARAGDLTAYADRSNILLLRQTDSGYEPHYLNLLNSKIMESDYYYMKPNDIIYIQPLKSKRWAFVSFPYSVVLSTITTTLLILNFFN